MSHQSDKFGYHTFINYALFNNKGIQYYASNIDVKRN